MSDPKISICVPAHEGMKDHDFFRDRLEKSVDSQSFKDYELIITYDGLMAENTNSAMRKANGEIIKILYLDDYLKDRGTLQHIADAFDENPAQAWLASGCVHNNGTEDNLSPHFPSWNPGMKRGINTIGSPSVVSLRNGLDMYFDETLSWVLDCDFYHRLHEKYGVPILLDYLDIGIGIGEHQTTHTMSDEAKEKEHDYLSRKYL